MLRPGVSEARVRYGPLSLFVWATNEQNRFIVTVYDNRRRRNVFRTSFEGTLHEATRTVHLAADQYLRGGGAKAAHTAEPERSTR